MKKINYFIVLCGLLSLVTFGFTSCSDDDEKFDNSAIIGKWQPVHVEGYVIYEGDKYEWEEDEDDLYSEYSVVKFKKDGSIDIYQYYDGELDEIYTDAGSYKLDGNKLKIKSDDGSITYKVMSLTDNKMILSYKVEDEDYEGYEEITYRKIED